MNNPYQSPKSASTQMTGDANRANPVSDLPSFFAWYFAAFIFAALLWHLSAFTRRIDFLELPMVAFHFPLAGFLDPHDFMVNDRTTFLYAVAFWAAVIPVALWLSPKQKNPLWIALAIIFFCATASVSYAILRAFTAGPVFEGVPIGMYFMEATTFRY
jgi:hypothetical protein